LFLCQYDYDGNPFEGNGRLQLNFKYFSQVSREKLKKGAHFQERLFGGEPRRRLLPN